MTTNGGVTIPKWAIAIVPLLCTVIGGGISYGVLKEKVQRNSDAIQEMAPYVRSIDNRLARIEGALNIKTSQFQPTPRLGIGVK